MIKRPMNNEKGFTLIEMLIAMAIGIALLATATYTYTKQSDVIRFGNQTTQTRGMARLALDELVTEIRRAGYGMPPGDSAAGRPARGISTATATSITYRANTDNFTTYAIDDNTNSGSNAVPVTDASLFSVNDNVAFFDTAAPANGRFGPLTSVIPGPDLIGFGSANGFTYEPIADNTAVVVNKYHTITYTYNSGPMTITVTDDGGNSTNTTTTVAGNVTDVTFSYFDASGTPLTTLPLNATDLGNVRRMNISITVQDRIETTVTETFDTDVTLRNMGT